MSAELVNQPEFDPGLGVVVEAVNANTRKFASQLIEAEIVTEAPQQEVADFVLRTFETLAEGQKRRQDQIPHRRRELELYLSGFTTAEIAETTAARPSAVEGNIKSIIDRIHRNVAPPQELRSSVSFAGAVLAKRLVAKETRVSVQDDVETEDIDLALDELLVEEEPEAEDLDVGIDEAVPQQTDEDSEVIIISDTDDDAPEQQVHVAGATSDPVKDYLRQIGKVPLLNAEQEVELSKRIEAGIFAAELLANPELSQHSYKTKDLEWLVQDGRNAKNHMLEANLRLVVSLAKRYTGRGMQLLDLIQEGNLGLVRAVEKFDYTKGYKFSTYATWWIRQSISRAMADQSRTIRIPVHMVEVINKMSSTKRSMLVELGREPTPEELAKELDMTPERVVEIQKFGREPISLHTPLGEDGDSEFGDLIEDSDAISPIDALASTMLVELIDSVLDTLSERERGVIRMRYGLDDGKPKTLDEIGKVYGVTRERIRQIEGKTMAKLRHPSRSEHLREFLE